MEFILQDEIENYGNFNHEKILLVDDNDTNIFVVKTILEDRGLAVDTALCGKEGIKKYKASDEYEYKIIFLDINMYDINGYDVSKEIRRSGRADAQTVPIYALSANIFAKDRVKAKEAGMNGYVTKPIIYKTLFMLIREILDEEKNDGIDHVRVREAVVGEPVHSPDMTEISGSEILENIGEHFIFNALNTIKGSVLMKSENSCSLINDLSAYMQYRFKTLGGETTISVKKELFYLEAYLRLEKARFSYINYEIGRFDDQTKEMYLPAMSLIFLAENAIHHGLPEKKYDKDEKAFVKINVSLTNEKTILCVEDNGAGFDISSVNFSKKFGGVSYISGLVKRLCEGELKIESEKNKGTKVMILLTGWRYTDENDCGR